MMETRKKAGGDEQQICIIKTNKCRCSNVSGDNEHQFCEKHYKIHKDFLAKNPSLQISNKSKQAKMKEKKKKKNKKKEIIIPPDEERCCRSTSSDRVRWRCNNFRMTKTVDGPDTTFCEKHYYALKKNYQLYLQRKKLKKTDADDNDEDECDDSDIETWDSRCSKQRKRGDDSTRGIQPPTNTTNHTSSDRIVEADDPNIDDEETRYPNCIKRRKLSEIADPAAIQPPATNHPIDTNSDTIIEEAEEPIIEEAEEPMVIPADKIIQEAEEPMVEVESFEHYKSKCFELSVELEKKQVELEKKTVECTELQSKLEQVDRTKIGDATDLESENLTMRSVESRVSNLESLVLRNGKDGSLLRCEELPSSENIIESEVRGSQNEITSSEIPRDENNMNKPNAETSSGGNKDSGVCELKTEEEVLNVNDWGCLEERPSQLGSPSQAHLQMSNKVFVNLVSDSDDDGDGLGEHEDSHTSFGDPVDMLAMKRCNRNNDEMTWKSEADMLSSFKEDPILCLKAVCALYRQEISEDEIPPKGLVIDSDTSRCIDLAKFLMDGDCKGDLKKSVKELETLDPAAVDDCRKLAVRYSVYIFDIYESKKVPFFFPATTASMEMELRRDRLL